MNARDVISSIELLSDQYGGTFKLDRNDADAIIAALRAAGYALVPVEPTEAMLQADEWASRVTMRRVWSAMISAAKEQP